MSLFEPAYRITAALEGGYDNDPRDKGGETYRGIARNFTGTPGTASYWQGWEVIDRYKRSGAIKTGTIFIELEAGVKNWYYKNKWVPSKAGAIFNQALANFVFDFYVNSGRAAEQINKAINKATGAGISESNSITAATISQLNAAPSVIYPVLVKQREQYLRGLDSWSDFGNGWLNRIASFPAYITASVIGASRKKKIVIAVSAALLLIMVFLYIKFSKHD
jgi:lysozyme family protein